MLKFVKAEDIADEFVWADYNLGFSLFWKPLAMSDMHSQSLVGLEQIIYHLPFFYWDELLFCLYRSVIFAATLYMIHF